MEEKLKNCPFCNDNDVWKRTYAVSGNVSFLCCKCGAEVVFHNAEKDPEATKYWNRRELPKEN